MSCQKYFVATPKGARRYGIATVLGIVTGIVSGMVKTGSEGILPPRTPDRIPPPIEMLNDMGFNAQEMVYHFSDHVINWGGNGIHYLFSIAFALFYCLLAEVYPKIKLWQGLGFGLLVAIGFHGIVLPLMGLSPAPWDLPADEIISEFIGTGIWVWVIEVMRRDLRNRWTGEPDPEYYFKAGLGQMSNERGE